MKRNFMLVAALVLVFPVHANAQVSSEERIQYLSEQLLLGAEVSLAGATLASTHIIPDGCGGGSVGKFGLRRSVV